MSDSGDEAARTSPTDDFFRAVVDHIAHPTFVKNREYRFVFVNRAFSEMLGYSQAEFLGKTDYDFFPKEEADFFRRKDAEMFETGREVVIDEEPITDAHGKRHVLATTKVPIFDRDGGIVYLTGIIHDITRLKDAEDELRRANGVLEERVLERTAALEAAQADLVRRERLAVLGLLAGGVAHQIRNPLAAIRTAAHVLSGASRSEGAPEIERMLRVIIREEVDRANRIVTDLIDYARVREPERKPVSSAYLIEQALSAHPPPNGVTLECDLKELPNVLVDAEQVQGALSNLVQNALDAVGEKGVVKVATSEHDGALCIRISDSGPGIPAEMAAHLFEPLFTTKTTGLGLGLVTARTLVENQGGSVTHVGQAPGATFEVHLPFA